MDCSVDDRDNDELNDGSDEDDVDEGGMAGMAAERKLRAAVEIEGRRRKKSLIGNPAKTQNRNPIYGRRGKPRQSEVFSFRSQYLHRSKHQ